MARARGGKMLTQQEFSEYLELVKEGENFLKILSCPFLPPEVRHEVAIASIDLAFRLQDLRDKFHEDN